MTIASNRSLRDPVHQRRMARKLRELTEERAGPMDDDRALEVLASRG